MARQPASERVRQASGIDLFNLEAGRIEMLFGAPLGQYHIVVGVIEIFTGTVPEVRPGDHDTTTGPQASAHLPQEEVDVVWLPRCSRKFDTKMPSK